MASLVVPAISVTIILSSFNRLLIKELLPTFGFPIRQTFVISSSDSVFELSSNFETTASNKSPSPIEFEALIGNIS